MSLVWQSVPLWICTGVLRIPTTSLRTGLGMTRKFFRLPSLRGRKAPVAIRSPAPKHLFPHPTQKRGGRAATSYKFSDCGALTPPADPPGRYAARLQLLLHSPQNDGAFCGGPWHEFQSSAEVNSACGKVLLRKTLVVEQKQQGKLRLRSAYSSSCPTRAICNSSNCFCSTVEGASIITSWAFLFMGKGMISRMELSPARSITIRSTPGAMPA